MASRAAIRRFSSGSSRILLGDSRASSKSGDGSIMRGVSKAYSKSADGSLMSGVSKAYSNSGDGSLMSGVSKRYYSAKANLPAQGPKANYSSKNYYSKSALPVPAPKLMFQVNGKLVHSMEAGSSTSYRMTIFAGSEEEAVESVQKFIALVRTNDPALLSTFLTSEVSLTEVSDFVTGAATEARKQAREYFDDIKAEVDSVKTVCVASKDEVLEVKKVVKRIEEENRRFTLLKLITYAGIISIVQGVVAGGVGWQYIKPYVPLELPTDDTCKYPYFLKALPPDMLKKRI